ncbi:hypothetical protein NFI96_020326 [Prochilodus magdalenae]|nr:hypothetical protein NFI96_020326 [Prochilodus magdalenae]
MESYRGRTSLFKEELKKGNTSLKLSALRLSDEGAYKCYLESFSWSDAVTVYVEVKGKGFHAWKIAIICIFVFAIVFIAFTAYILKDKLSKKKLSPAQCSVITYTRLQSKNVKKELDLKKFNTSEEGYSRLIPAITNCRKAQFAGCNLTEQSLKNLSAALQRENSSLKELDLSNSDLQDLGLEKFSAGLKSSNCKLEVFRLVMCKLSTQSCDTLQSLLQLETSSLKELDLSMNDLQDSGVEKLSAGLKSSHCKLEILRLALCNLGGNTCENLGSALQSENWPLKGLDLSKNNLQDSGMKTLSAGLNSSQCKLEIIRNNSGGLDQKGTIWFVQSNPVTLQPSQVLQVAGVPKLTGELTNSFLLVDQAEVVNNSAEVQRSSGLLLSEKSGSAFSQSRPVHKCFRLNTLTFKVLKRMKNEFEQAYQLAQATSAKMNMNNKLRYDQKVHYHCLSPRDRVLIRNLGLKGKQKLADRWGSDPYVVESKLSDLPVYHLKPMNGVGPPKVMHRNHLLPLGQAVRLSPEVDSSPVPSPRPLRQRKAKDLNTSSEPKTTEPSEDLECVIQSLSDSESEYGCYAEALVQNTQTEEEQSREPIIESDHPPLDDVAAPLECDPLDTLPEALVSSPVSEVEDSQAGRTKTVSSVNRTARLRCCPGYRDFFSMFSWDPLRKAHLPPPILTTFYRGTIESILSSCITAWFGNCTASDRKSLQRVVRTAEKIIGVSLPTITDIYTTRCIRKTTSIVDDHTHPSHTLFTLLPSGKRLAICSFAVESCKSLISALQTKISSIKELDLSSNELQDSLVELLSAGLKTGDCKLEILRLALCNLPVNTCENLGSLLKLENSFLKELDLSNNDLQNSGVELLSGGLKSAHCKLEILRLSGCMITEKGGSSLGSALSSNPSHMKELDLTYNHPGEYGENLLSARLEDPQCALKTLR